MPVPGEGQALVRVKAVTTCPQWDMHIYNGKPMFVGQPPIAFPYPPGQPGHEMTGIVVAVGPGCSLQMGQTVCAWKDPGKSKPGCYAEYVLMQEEHLMAVPPELPVEKVASLELAMCVSASIMRLGSLIGIAGKSCIVNGLGSAGLIAMQLLLAEGATQVIGVDPNAKRREVALAMGAKAAYDPADSPLPLRRKPGAAHLAVDCVGYPEAVRFVMDRTNEAVSLFAVQRDDYVFRHGDLVLVGYPGHSREAADYALNWIAQGKLDLSPLISDRLPLTRYNEGVERLMNQAAIKICFVPNEGGEPR
jgi:threonine dehydrogenase-like Zn-dependent dehydrogenase